MSAITMEIRPFTICSACLRASTRRVAAPLSRRAIIATTILQRANISSPAETIHHRRAGISNRQLTTGALSAGRIDLNALQARVQELSDTILQPQDGPVPSEQRTLYVLEQIDAIARSVADVNSIAGAASLDKSAASALLGSVSSRRAKTSITKAVLLNTISKRAEEILRSPNVFITPAILKTYVQLQKLLHQPASFPDIFELYASKPAPHAGANGDVTYTETNPNNVKAAVDRNVAKLALDSAIAAHDLELSLQVIDTTVAAPAYTRAKIVRQCAVPGIGLALLPGVVYGVSSQFSNWQTMMDHTQATGIAFAGIMTYAGVVGSMGYVAMTTANDQMERVTWAHGVPLWERWVREEERAAFDSIASAWGFKSLEKRGEEEGEDWEILRETCGRRGMELDRIDLMEGMQ